MLSGPKPKSARARPIAHVKISVVCALARASRAAGATALMVHQPPDPFVSPRGVVAYVERVSEAGGGLPLMLEERARFVELIASNILEIGDELLERAVAETGLPRTRIEGERARTVGQLRLFAQGGSQRRMAGCAH